MAVLVDMHGTMIANIMVGMSKKKDEEGFSINLVRQMILNSLRLYRGKFFDEYGELILCYDDNNFWRKQIFPYYKAHRRAMQEKSPHDWDWIFQTMKVIKEEFKEWLPYKVLQVSTTEADDIIGVLAKRISPYKVLIIAADKDFLQLQKYPGVEQYNPITNRFLVEKNPVKFLKRQIMKGDRGDGVPNILSPGNSFVDKIRQKPMREQNIIKWLDMEPDEFCETEQMKVGWVRNEKLIDLEQIPASIQTRIIDQFNLPVTNTRKGLMMYFMSYSLTELMPYIREF